MIQPPPHFWETPPTLTHSNLNPNQSTNGWGAEIAAWPGPYYRPPGPQAGVEMRGLSCVSQLAAVVSHLGPGGSCEGLPTGQIEGGAAISSLHQTRDRDQKLT